MVFKIEEQNLNPVADVNSNPQPLDVIAEFDAHKQKSQDVLKYGVQAALVGAFDTIAQSVNAIDDKESVTTWLQGQNGLENFSAFYKENREGAKLVGEIGTSFVPIFAASKLVRVGSVLDKALTGIRGGEQLKKFVLSSGKSFRERLDTRAEDFKIFAAEGSTAVSSTGKLAAAIRQESLGAAGDMLKETVAADLAILVLYNDSDVFFEEDKPLTNFLMFAIPDALFVGAAFKGTQIAMKRHIQNVVGPEVAKAINPLDIAKTDVLDRAELRGVPMAVSGVDINASRAVKAKVGPENATARENAGAREQAAIASLQKSTRQLAVDNVYKSATTVITGRHPTKRFEPNQQQVNAVVDATIADPNLAIPFQGLDDMTEANINGMQKGIDKLIKEYDNQIQIAQRSGDPDAITWTLTKERNKLKEHTQVVVETDGSLTPLSQRTTSILDKVQKMRTVTSKEGNMQFVAAERKASGVDISVNRIGNMQINKIKNKGASSFDVLGKKQKSVFSVSPNRFGNLTAKGITRMEQTNAQTLTERDTVWALMQKQMQDFKVGEDKIVLDSGSHFTKVDYALEVIRKKPEVDPNKIVAIGESSNLTKREIIDNLEYLSLEQKLPEYAKLKMTQLAVKNELIKDEFGKELSDYTIARYLNLPSPTSVGVHPIVQMLDDLVPATGDLLPTLRAFTSHIGDVRARMVSVISPDLLGTPLTRDLRLGGNSLNALNDGTRASVIASVANSSAKRIDRDQINTVIAATKAAQNAKFANANPTEQPITKGMFEFLMSQEAAMLKAGEVDTLIDVGGANAIGQFRNFANRDSPVLKAVDSLADSTFKLTDKIIADKFSKEAANFDKLFVANNKTSLITFNTAMASLRVGWDVLDEPVAVEAGKWALRLDLESARNQTLVKKLFGLDEVPELMPTRAGAGNRSVPVIMDDIAMNGLQSATKLSQEFLDELNYVRQIRGQQEIVKRPWHVPYVNALNRERLFLQDSSGKVVQPVYGYTFAEVRKEAQQAVADAAKQGQDLTIVSEKSAKAYNDNFLQTWEQSDSLVFSGKQSGGRGGKGVNELIDIGEDGLKDVISNLNSNFSQLTKYIMSTIFESELQYTRTAKQAAAGVESRREVANQTKWDEYENILLQKSSVDINSGIGKLYTGVEGFADDVLRKVWDEKNNFIGKPNQVSEKEFAELNKFLGKDQNPFDSVTAMIKRTTEKRMPVTFRKSVTSLNKFTTNMVLRIFDFGMPLINFASLASVTPAVVASMRRGKNESIAEWRSRNSILGTPINDDDIIPNTGRLTQTAIQGIFDPDVRAATKRAADMGLINGQVAEDLAALTGPSKGYVGGLLKRGIDIASIPTDWSERVSRHIAFSMMYKIGKTQMRLGDDAATLFASQHANQIVGDYRPTNRPQMFQGATGMPLGLFTTWAWNFLQRVYGDAVDFRGNALLAQAAMQQFMFGFQSMPGAETFINTFTTSYDGSTNIIDSMDSKFGTTATDMYMSGTLANLTGMAIQSRAAISAPALFQGGPIEQAIPGLSAATTIMQGVGEAFKSIRANGGFDGQEMAEIASIYGVNGTLKNGIQYGLNYSLDRRRNIVQNDIRSFENAIPRLFELKSVREKRRFDQLQKDRVHNEIKKSHMEKLSTSLKADFRKKGGLTREDVEKNLQGYYKVNGSLDYYKRYFKSQLLNSQFSTFSRKFTELAKKSSEAGEMQRLFELQAEDKD